MTREAISQHVEYTYIYYIKRRIRHVPTSRDAIITDTSSHISSMYELILQLQWLMEPLRLFCLSVRVGYLSKCMRNY